MPRSTCPAGVPPPVSARAAPTASAPTVAGATAAGARPRRALARPAARPACAPSAARTSTRPCRCSARWSPGCDTCSWRRSTSARPRATNVSTNVGRRVERGQAGAESARTRGRRARARGVTWARGPLSRSLLSRARRTAARERFRRGSCSVSGRYRHRRRVLGTARGVYGGAAPAHDVGDDAAGEGEQRRPDDPLAEPDVRRLAASSPSTVACEHGAVEQLGAVRARAPSASMTAVMPEIAACTTGRPVSAARIWPIATCCAELADRRYERLFVDTTITCGAVAHERPDLVAERRLEADHRRDLDARRSSKRPGVVPGCEVARDLVERADHAFERSCGTARTRRTARGAASRRCPASVAVGSVEHVRGSAPSAVGRRRRRRVGEHPRVVLAARCATRWSPEERIGPRVGVHARLGEHDQVDRVRDRVRASAKWLRGQVARRRPRRAVRSRFLSLPWSERDAERSRPASAAAARRRSRRRRRAISDESRARPRSERRAPDARPDCRSASERVDATTAGT